MWYLRRMGTSRSESLLTKSTFFSSFASWCFSLRTILQRRHCHTQVVRRARVSRDGVMRTIAQTLQRVEECGHAQNLTQPQQLECARPEHTAEVITTLACGHEPSLPHQDSCWLELRRRLIAHSAAQPTSNLARATRLAASRLHHGCVQTPQAQAMVRSAVGARQTTVTDTGRGQTLCSQPNNARGP
jgi:hypothetical protein